MTMKIAEEIALNAMKPGTRLRLEPIKKLPNMDRDIVLDGITDCLGEPAILYGVSETCDGYSIPFSWIESYEVLTLPSSEQKASGAGNI